MVLESDFSQRSLDAAVATVLEQRRGWLRFPRPLEAKFECDRSAARSRHLASAVLIATLLYDLFLLCDYRFAQAYFLRCLVLRLAIVTPLTLGTYFWLRYDPPRQVRETITVLLSCIVCVATLYLWEGISGVATVLAQAALILLILFINTLIRLRFPYALAITLFCIMNGAAFLYRDPWLTAPEKATCYSLLLTATVFTLVANYWMEREERLGYLLRVQVEQRGRELSLMNQELTRVSNLDALTGLTNRRYFSIGFAQAWDQARRAQTPLSLLLIDIDRFKKINDSFGHLYGDEMLLRLAAMLSAVLRREENVVVARYGGEEFVVLLPGVALDQAMVIAERLRKLAHSLDTKAVDGITPSPITISIGAAGTTPDNYAHREELLRDADLALYRAKRHGRDQVWQAVRGPDGTCEFFPGTALPEPALAEMRRA